jgi:hypothetical protein
MVVTSPRSKIVAYEPGLSNPLFNVTATPVAVVSTDPDPSSVFAAATPFTAKVTFTIGGLWKSWIVGLGVPLKLRGYALAIDGMGTSQPIGPVAAITTTPGVYTYTMAINSPGLPAGTYMLTTTLASTAGAPLGGFDQVSIEATA